MRVFLNSLRERAMVVSFLKVQGPEMPFVNGKGTHKTSLMLRRTIQVTGYTPLTELILSKCMLSSTRRQAVVS